MQYGVQTLAVVKFYYITLSLFVGVNNNIKGKTGVDVVVQFYPWLNCFLVLNPLSYSIVSKTVIDDSGNELSTCFQNIHVAT